MCLFPQEGAGKGSLPLPGRVKEGDGRLVRKG